jgi:hypothetical protein
MKGACSDEARVVPQAELQIKGTKNPQTSGKRTPVASVAKLSSLYCCVVREVIVDVKKQYASSPILQRCYPFDQWPVLASISIRRC